MDDRNSYRVGEYVIVYQGKLYYKAQVTECLMTSGNEEARYIVRYVVSYNR